MRGRAWPANAAGTGTEFTLGHVDASMHMEAENVLALHDALTALQKLDERKARVVELRYFGGLSIEETAEALNVSTVTVTRDWQVARAWLASELGGAASSAR